MAGVFKNMFSGGVRSVGMFGGEDQASMFHPHVNASMAKNKRGQALVDPQSFDDNAIDLGRTPQQMALMRAIASSDYKRFASAFDGFAPLAQKSMNARIWYIEHVIKPADMPQFRSSPYSSLEHELAGSPSKFLEHARFNEARFGQYIVPTAPKMQAQLDRIEKPEAVSNTI